MRKGEGSLSAAREVFICRRRLEVDDLYNMTPIADNECAVPPGR